MAKIRYDATLMNYLALFERVTRARPKDCLVNKNETIVFIVHEGQLGKAIGKHAMNLKKLSSLLKKKIKIVEFSPDLGRFIKNLVAPLQLLDIKENEGVVVLKGPDVKTKGLLIGRDLQNIRETETIVKRFFNIQSLKVI